MAAKSKRASAERVATILYLQKFVKSCEVAIGNAEKYDTDPREYMRLKEQTEFLIKYLNNMSWELS